MDTQAYIASGILELYVAGLLSPIENLEVYDNAQQYPEIQKEIEAIEAAVIALTKTANPGYNQNNFRRIQTFTTGVQKDESSAKNRKLFSGLGWAAALILAAGLVWMYTQNNDLKSEIEVVNQQKDTLEKEVYDANIEVTENERILNIIRDQDVSVIALGGQTVSPSSFAKAYWNKNNQKVVIDATGLPEPPPGFTYQVWSLKLDPLTPTSLGLLDDFAENDKRLFELNNSNESEAFGITLEPEGGSETPNLEQLYTLGTVAS